MKQTKHLRFWISVEKPKDFYQEKQVFWNVSGMKKLTPIKRVVSYDEIKETINGLIEIYGKAEVEKELGIKIDDLDEPDIKVNLRNGKIEGK